MAWALLILSARWIIIHQTNTNRQSNVPSIWSGDNVNRITTDRVQSKFNDPSQYWIANFRLNKNIAFLVYSCICLFVLRFFQINIILQAYVAPPEAFDWTIHQCQVLSYCMTMQSSNTVLIVFWAHSICSFFDRPRCTQRI